MYCRCEDGVMSLQGDVTLDLSCDSADVTMSSEVSRSDSDAPRKKIIRERIFSLLTDKVTTNNSISTAVC